MEPISLTTLGAIASIASILNHGSDLVKKFRKRRKERKKAKENKALQKSIKSSHARNRQAYDDAVRLLEQRFGYNDDISKSQFRLTSSKMRRWIDLTLASSRDEVAIVFPKAILLRSMSDEIQSSVRSDLPGLSQRMMQATPIRNFAFNDSWIWDGPTIGGNRCSGMDPIEYIDPRIWNKPSNGGNRSSDMGSYYPNNEYYPQTPKIVPKAS
ncbi:hypothetical protein PG997_000206 [Apiospora hydei]|uniref:Uncharacterized protein n=1 Tax=Apiospora hydei TaxID=1337664 RepID=A0ABR1XA48_9PEZI